MTHLPRTEPGRTEPAPTEPASGAVAPSGGAGPAGGVLVAARRRRTGWIRRRRAGVLFGVAMAVALAVILILQSTQRADNQELSVRNPGPQGARAAAQILGAQGVTVAQTASFDETLAAARAAGSSGSGSTVLVYDQRGFLAPERLRRLLAATDRLVVVSPRLATLTGLGSTIRQAGVVPGSEQTLQPGCAVADAQAAGDISADGGFLYTGGTVCYGAGGGARGLYATAENGKLVVIGSTAVISNQFLAANGNAALTLRTLGSQGHLVWYLPGPGDLGGNPAPKTLAELAPAWSAFVAPWLLVVALFAVLWRGRRLGPLVFEPLPVVVKSAETAEGRARLYHEAHDVARAADTLRAGTIVRLASALRVGTAAGFSDVAGSDVAAAAARHLDRNAAEIQQILQHRPATEAQLVRWAQDLVRLEKEVKAR
ncbi:hypothetical protein QFZ23_003300 [Arthrobacter globiformis]|uniref:DUF4350 domain-containing protein n=1 Tax=Arthrobacter globiformis TaxID=1665 RepID=UPI002786418F|nr:DUF4350 domain-containing protein [Arthrobacter globiformis]MDQ1059399.1 hypothetical protein [Arthrobacter globiformis]